MANGPGKCMKIPELLQAAGDLIGDPFEVSTLRREDYITVEGKSEYEDLLQSTNAPSTASSRGSFKLIFNLKKKSLFSEEFNLDFYF